MTSYLRKISNGLALLTSLFILIGCADEPPTPDIPMQERNIPALSKAQSIERLVTMDSTTNFRDMGGFKTTDGKQVKWGMVYRSDALDELTPTDNQLIDRLDIKYIADFRTVEEVEESPDVLSNPNIELDLLPIGEGMPSPLTIAGYVVRLITDTEAMTIELEQGLIKANEDLVKNYSGQYRQWANSLLEPEKFPMVYHCTQGKDRTGLASAIILLALGVDKETIINDYMATNHYAKADLQRAMDGISRGTFGLVDSEAFKPVLFVRRANLEAAFRAMEEQYGSIDNYLEQALGLDQIKRNQLRDLLLVSDTENSAPTKIF